MDAVPGMRLLVASVEETLRERGTAEIVTDDVARLWAAIEEGVERGDVPGDPLASAGAAADEEEATVLVAALLGAAAACSAADAAFFHYWLSETVRGWFADTRADAASLRASRARFQDMVTLGINLRGWTEPEFLAAWHEVGMPGEVTATSAFGGAVACATFAGPALHRALGAAAWTGEPAWAASLTLARLAGAYYGTAGIDRLEDEERA